MDPYKKLAHYYDSDWGNFSYKYLDFLDLVFSKFKINPSSIWDISCGSGNVVSVLSKKGFNIIGSDISEEMIRVSKNKSPDINFFVMDMRELESNKKFDLILSGFDSINYILELGEVNEIFLKVKNLLNEDGIFIFDVTTPYNYKLSYVGEYNRKVNEKIIKQNESYDPITKIAKVEYNLDGFKEIHKQRAYTYQEIKDILNKNLFSILGVYEDFDLSIVNDYSNRLFFICKKS
ncbi:MAG: class I SAM-dependent methyltransferase [Candidatus Pacearchaeota archaeon]|jgi:2-polyprenyl-3-methyl-5-hydroxy-6-metoxy-1,4-benzoquinol methylase